MRIEHNDQTFRVPSIESWRSQRTAADRFRGEEMDAAARLGRITSHDGQPLEGMALQRVRDRLLGTYATMPAAQPLGVGGTPLTRRWLVADVWRYGTILMGGGNPKAGKTMLAIDLTAALLTPGRRFLNHFEVPDLAEKERDLWLINAETPAQDFEAEMVAQGLGRDSEVIVDHLEELGGAQVFDLTDPDIYDWWAHRFAYCQTCDGSDDGTPFIVIVDGLTAILQAAGKGVEHYGLWFAAFRRLMRQLDVPSALVIGHNTLAGGHLMGGVEAQAGADGLITYSSDNPDRPGSPRRFSVVPRLGGRPVGPLEVCIENGRLQVVAPSTTRPPPEPRDEALEVAGRIAAYVAEHPGAHGQELTDHVEASSKQANLDGRERAQDLGLIREEHCNTEGCDACESQGRRPHHRRRHYWPVPADPPP